MRRFLRHILSLLFVVAMLSLSGCNLISLDSFSLEGAKITSFDLSKGATVEMTIRNKSPFKVTIAAGRLEAKSKGESIGEVFMKNSVVLPRKATTTVELNLGLSFASPFAALKALNILSSSPDELTISGYGEGRIWIFRKRYERHDVPISKFISIFGRPSDYLNNTK